MDTNILNWIKNGCTAEGAAAAGIYPASVHAAGDGFVAMADCGDADKIVAVDCAAFHGDTEEIDGKQITLAPLNHENADALRTLFPFTAPVPVLRKTRTIGLGDRLGLATDGHIRALESYDAYPIFAQQSIRELTLTERTFADVIDSATFAVFRNDFKRGFGADGDHLKTPKEVEDAIAIGCTMITLDCSEHIHGGSAEDALPDNYAALQAEYEGKRFSVEEHEIVFDAETLSRAAKVYCEALDFAERIYRDYIDGSVLDFELSIDETAVPTTPAEHYFVANELKRRGVAVATVAPRFCGEFQKGIDYIGDVAQYAREFAVHAAIARAFGYKISIHSGSDKFSIFAVSGKLSRGNFHVKTAGTNWLEAMQLVAEVDPALYREVHAFALAHFKDATAYYHVTTNLDNIPALDSLKDDALPALFENPDARQLIHITYGLILSARNEDGSPVFRDRLYKLWRTHREAYAEKLEKHIGRHLAELYKDIPAD